MTTITDCILAVSREFRIPLPRLLGERRAREIARPRQIAMWLAVRATGSSLPQIGRALNRDHTTVLHGIGVIEDLREKNLELRAVTTRLLLSVLDPAQEKTAV